MNQTAKAPMTELQVSYRAIAAACVWNLTLVANGYGCDDVELFNDLVAEMAKIVKEMPHLDVDDVAEFYELHV